MIAIEYDASARALHGGVLCIAGLWLAKQHNNWSFARLSGRARKEQA